jgi:hypothetical protein
MKISTQGAVAVAKRHGFTLADVREGSCCLNTGAKLAWNREDGYLIYGYSQDCHDLEPFAKYSRERVICTDEFGSFRNKPGRKIGFSTNMFGQKLVIVLLDCSHRTTCFYESEVDEV